MCAARKSNHEGSSCFRAKQFKSVGKQWHTNCHSCGMDYVKPTDVLDNMLKAGATKAALAPRDLIIRGILSGGLLGISTSLALTATLQTNLPIIAALIFPVGLVLIVLLGLELVTGSFALVPLARARWARPFEQRLFD